MQFDRLRRRELLTLLGAAAAWPLAARAQQPTGRGGKMPRVGLLMPGPPAHSAAVLDPLYRGLHELGYIEARDLVLEQRNADWKPDRARWPAGPPASLLPLAPSAGTSRR